MENKHLLKLFILGLTFAGLTAGLLRWETETAAQKEDVLLADNVWTGAAGNLWNTTHANWSNPTVWNNANADSAIFNGARVGFVGVDEPITLRGMRFDVNGYSLTTPGSLTFAAGGGGSLAPGEIQVATGVSAEMNNALSGTVGLTKTGGGTLILYNTDLSNYTGTTTISAGKLQIGFGIGGSLGNIPNNPVNMAANTTLEFNRSLSFTFSGLITAANGASVIKNGTSTMTLSAADNRLSNLIINSGTLATTGTGNISSNVNINGGTFRPSSGSLGRLNVSGGTLAPSGHITCNELNLSGGTVETGCSDPNLLTATGGTISPGGQGTTGLVGAYQVTLNSATTLHVELGGGTPDQLVAWGYWALPFNNINLGGAQLTGALINGFNPAPGQQFVIVLRAAVTSPGVGTINGQFAQGGQVTFSGRRFSITYTNSNVTLTALERTGRFDFDGDSRTDIGIYRPSNGQWWYQRSSDNQVNALTFGASTDRITPADYTGDGKTDIAFWRPSTGEWFILRSEDLSYYAFHFGTAGDLPAPADFDGDLRADAAVFRPSTGTWYINKSTGGTEVISFGQNGDLPTVGDYDGDGEADVAIFRPNVGQWWINRSTAGAIGLAFGNSTDKPVPGNYTGDGKTDVAFWRPSTGEWFVLRSENFSYYSVFFGTSGDTPTPGDYDGDGKFDVAVFRSSNQNWYVDRTISGLLIQQFGQASDTPVPSAFVP